MQDLNHAKTVTRFFGIRQREIECAFAKRKKEPPDEHCLSQGDAGSTGKDVIIIAANEPSFLSTVRFDQSLCLQDIGIQQSFPRHS